MYYRVIDIWEQAKQDEFAVALDGDGFEARLCYGTKIVNDFDTDSIKFYNTTKGGGFYKELTATEIAYFCEMGWRGGVYQIAVETYKEKLDKIEDAIKREMNSRKNPKQIQSLKSARERILNQYRKMKSKINKYEY